MPASLRAACLIILSVFAWLWAAQDAHADVSCSVSQSEVVYYLDAEQEACRTGGEHPAHGAMVRAELGGDYVAMDVSYAAGAGPQEPTDLQCLEGVCGVGPYDGEGGYQVGDVLACEGNCRGSFSYSDEHGNTKTVLLEYDEPAQVVVATLSGASGPPTDGVLTVNVPASLPVQNTVFTLDYDFSEVARRADEAGNDLPVTIEGGILDRTVVEGVRWSVRIVPTAEGTLTITLPQDSMVGDATDNPLDKAYTTTVPIDMTPPTASVVHLGDAPTGAPAQLFGFSTDDPVAVLNQTASVSVSGMQASVEIDREAETFTVTPAGAGTANIVIDAGAFTDPAGNDSQASATFPYTFGDDTIDVVGIDVAQSAPYRASDAFTFTVRVSQQISAGQVSLAVDGATVDRQPISNGAARFDEVFLAAGERTLEATFEPGGTDYTAGQSSTRTMTVEKGQAAPTLDEVQGAQEAQSDLRITGTLNRNHGGTLTLERSIDGGAFASTGEPITRDGDGFEVTTALDTAGIYDFRARVSETADFEAAVSNVIRVEVTQRTTTGGLSADASSYDIGARPELTATLESAETKGNVTFRADGAEIGVVTVSSGSAILVAPALAEAGTVTYSATFRAEAPWSDADLGSVEITVRPQATSLSLEATSEETTPVVGSAIQLSAAISPATATGEVSFYANDVLIGSVAASNGAAVLEDVPDEAGQRTYRAEYAGDPDHGSSSSADVTISVARTQAGVSLTTDKARYLVSENIEMTATFNDSDVSGGVSFTMSGQDIGTAAVVDGVATFAIKAEQAGSLRLGGQYSGDGVYEPVTLPVVDVVVEKLTLTGTVTLDRQGYALGETATARADLDAQDASGWVSFFVDDEAVDRVAVSNGAAETTLPAWQEAGAARVSARYEGDGVYLAADLPEVSAQIARGGTTLTLASDATTYEIGDRPLLRAETSPAATGQVIFLRDGVEIGTSTLSAGRADLVAPSLESAGEVRFSARYDGSANHEAATSNDVTVSIQAQSVSVSMTLNGASGDAEVLVDEEVRVEAVFDRALAGGTVSLYQNGSEIGSMAANGRSFSFLADTATQGEHTLQVRYSGDASALPASSAQRMLWVNNHRTRITLTVSDASPNVGETITVTAFVSPDVAGMVAFADGEDFIGTGPVLGGQAYTTFTVTEPVHQLAAFFMPEDRRVYEASESNSVTVAAGKTATSIDLDTASAVADPGEAFTISGQVADASFTGSVALMRREEEGGFSLLETQETSSARFSFQVSETEAGAVAYHVELVENPHFAAMPSELFEADISFLSGAGILSVDPASAFVGDRVMLSFRAADSAAAGTVDFFIDGMVVGSSYLRSGAADLEVTLEKAGSRVARARYAGSSTHEPYTTADSSLEVSARSASIEITADRSQYGIGEVAEFTVTATETAVEGPVQLLRDGNTVRVESMINGEVRFPVTLEAEGTFSYSARFEGSDTHGVMESSNAAVIEVVRGLAEGTLTATPASLEIDEETTLSLQVEPSTATGSVEFRVDGSSIGTSRLTDGEAQMAYRPESAGEQAVSARYLGDDDHAAFDADPIMLDVQKIATTASLSTDKSRYEAGEYARLTLTFDRSEVSGMVEFFEDGVSLGMAPLASGQVSLSVELDAVGEIAFTAAYAGDDRHASFTSEAATVTVEADLSSVTLNGLPERMRADAVLNLSGEISIADYNVGFDDVVTVEVQEGAAGWSEAFTLDAAGDAWSGQFEPAGPGGLRLRARIVDDAQPDGYSYSEVRDVEIYQDDTSLVLQAASEQVGISEPVDLTIAVSPGDVPGMVEVYAGDQLLGEAVIEAGSARFEASFEAEGRYALRAVYAGSKAHTPGVSNEVVVDAGRGFTELRLEADAGSYPVGATAVLTATLAPGLSGETIHLDIDGTETAAEVTSDGVAQFEVVLERAGVREAVARFSGSDTHAPSQSDPISLVAERLQTAGRLSSDAEAYAPGQVARFTVDLNSDSAAGQVIIRSQDAVLAHATAVDGVATAEVEMTQEGLIEVSAHYEGDDEHSAWSSEEPLYIAVGRDLREISLEASNAKPGLGEAITLDGSVSGEDVNGTVKLFELVGGSWAEVAEMPLEAMEFSFDLMVEAEGERAFRVELAEHGSIAAAPSETVRIETWRAVLGATLETDRDVYSTGETAQLTFRVDDAAAAGEVSFRIGDETPFARVMLEGGAAETSLLLEDRGVFEVFASYAGDDAFAGAEASASVSVDVAPTTGAMSADQAHYAEGDTARISVSIAPTEATGDVVLLEAGEEIDRAELVSGEATFDLPLPASGRRELHARYLGDDAHAAWSSPEPLVLEIGLVEIAMTLDVLTTSPKRGEEVQFRLTVDPDPSEGEAEIMVTTEGDAAEAHRSAPAATESRSVPLVGQGSYDFAVIMPMQGSLTVEALFAGSETHASASSGAEVVEPAAGVSSTTELILSDPEPKAGEIITLSATVTPSAASGDVEFLVDSEVVGRAALTSGTASTSWTVTSGEHVLQARYLGDAEHEGSTSEETRISVRPRALDLFDERRAFIERIMDEEIDRASDARARVTERRMAGVRDRLRNEDVQHLPRTQEEMHGEWRGSQWEPFSYQGDVRGTNGAFDANGTFSARRRIGGTDLSQFVDGSFEVTSRSDYGTSLEGNLSTSIEKRVSNDVIVGATVGVEAAETAISGEMDGTMRTAGVNAGVYGARKLGQDVVVDGFANVARLEHELDLKDDELETDSRYGSTAVQVGGTVSGRYQLGKVDFLPAVTLRHTMAVRDRATFRARADGEEAEAVVAGRTTHKTRAEFTPEVKFYSKREGGVVTSIRPKVICEAEESTECGVGIGAGVEAPIADGRGKVKAEASIEKVGDETRKQLFLGFEFVF